METTTPDHENKTANTTENSAAEPKYWQSLQQWQNDPEFEKLADQEFQNSPLSSDDGKDGWARREFLKLMGASMALTSFGCVRRPAQKIVPYVKRPKEVTPGISNHYASTYADGSEGFGLVVTTREGRPIKAEGNPEHPVNEGGMSARAHAHILALYDPDRLGHPVHNLLNEKKNNRDTIKATWEDLDKKVSAQLKKGGVAVLTSSLSSPSTTKLLSEFKTAFAASHYVWEPINQEDVALGQKLSYGSTSVPRYRFDKAKYVVSVDADFLGTYLAPTENSRSFSKGRKPGADMSKLVSFESVMSLTGMNSDERYRIAPSQQVSVVMGLLHSLIVVKGRSRYATESAVKSALKPYANVAAELGIPKGRLAQVADGLWGHRGKGLVLAGGLAGKTSSAVGLQVAVNFLNTVLNNDGSTVVYEGSNYTGYQGSTSSLSKLTAALDSGKVKSVVIFGVNPAFSAAKNSGFTEALAKAEMVVYCGDRNDETGLVSDYVASVNHPMESWGDAEYQKGTYSVQQPTIRPLGDTRSFEDSLIAWGQAAGKGSFENLESFYEYVQNNWKKNIFAKAGKSGNFDDQWLKLLHEGVLVTGPRNKTSKVRSFNTRALSSVKVAKGSDFELVLYPTVGLKDGSLANVAWLHEMPDPVTKICWDNYLTVSPKTAHDNHLQEGQVVELSVGSEKRSVPVHIQPGQHDKVLGLAVGFGRTAAGAVANGIGVEAISLADASGDVAVFSGLAASFKKTKKKIELADTQGHHTMKGRQIVVEATNDQFQKNPAANIHKHKLFSMWGSHEYTGNKWGMSVDLNSCTGCSACVVACQSENNIPTVGKTYLLQGREMHWMRIDHYYVGDPESPDTVIQPVMCQHCDNAPCESVCPVAATVHSDEGTNDMIYNRCVGTRYCANNCPYKVRRFNWFDYVAPVRKPLNMAMNPEVTVRARGVMEKCSFCIHRIKEANHTARVEKRELKDGDVVTACQQSCPTNAIVFGDMNNKESAVAKELENKRGYTLLEEFNNLPAVRYMSKIRNTDQLKGGHGSGHDEKKQQHGKDNGEGHHS